MHRNPLVSLAAVALAAAAGAQDAAVVERQGRTFRAVVAPGALPAKLAERLCAEVLDAAEAAAKAAQKELGARVKGKPPLRLFAVREEFEAAALAAGADAAWLAETIEFAPAGGAEGLVLLAPLVPEPVLERAGLPAPVHDAIVRTAVRVAIAQQAPLAQPRDWLVEVLAFGAGDALANPERAPGVSVEQDSRRQNLEHYKYGRQFRFGDLLAEQWPDVEIAHWSARDCCLSLCAEFLGREDVKYGKKLLQALRKRPKGADARAHCREVVVDLLGGEWLAIDAAFARCLEAQHPVWTQSTPMLDARRQPWVLAGARELGANVMRLDKLPDGDFAIRGAAEVLTTDEGLRVLLDWDGTDMIGAIFDRAGCRIARFAAGSAQWETLREVQTGVAVGAPFAFAVEVRGGSVRMAVDGEARVSWSYAARDMHRMWGFGTNGGVLLRDVKVEPLR
ncbi:MAG: hypothetical protein AB7O97_07000 [Planctomycetota bacterium]